MNQAHLHLIIVHIPIVLVPAALVLYSIGCRWSSKPLQLVALNAFALAAVFAGCAFLLGEGAEEIVERMAGVAESAIESHEESAEVAIWLTIALGVTSLANLISFKFAIKRARLFVVPVILLGMVSSASLAYTAQEGGKIRHPEAFNQSSTGVSSMNKEYDDD